jgi:hypothetical protein
MADYGYSHERGFGLRDALNAAYPMTGMGEYGMMFPPNSGSPTPEAPVPIPRQRPPQPLPAVQQNNLNVPQAGTPAYQAMPPNNPGPAPLAPVAPPYQMAPAGGPVALPPGGVNLPRTFPGMQRLRGQFAPNLAPRAGFNPALAAQLLARYS